VFAVPGRTPQQRFIEFGGPFPGVVPQSATTWCGSRKAKPQERAGLDGVGDFHSAGWSRSASRFLHRLQQRTGTIHTGLARSSPCLVRQLGLTPYVG
jgi:hypothetical protein